MKSSRVSLVVAVAATVMASSAVHANAAQVDPGATVYASGAGNCKNRTNSDCGTLHLDVALSTSDTPTGTTVLLELRGCEGDQDVRMVFPDPGPFPKVGTPYTIGDTTPVSDDGTRFEVPYSFWTSYPGETFHLGPEWTGTLTVTRPGSAPSVQQISHASPSGDATLGRYTDKLVCPRDDPDPSALVDTWGKVTGKPIVGRRISLTPTTFVPAGQAIGAKASYAWLIDGRVVSRKLHVLVKRGWKGKVLGIRTTISAPGKKDDVYNGYLGRVRVRR